MGTLVELSGGECLELLQRQSVGRVAISTPVGPRLVPVNYRVQGDGIVFRTTPYSELGTYARDALLAFEVDEIDYATASGRSAVLVGRAEVVEDPAELRRIQAEANPTPWPAGRRSMYIRVRIRDLTGRRIVPDS